VGWYNVPERKLAQAVYSERRGEGYMQNYDALLYKATLRL